MNLKNNERCSIRFHHRFQTAQLGYEHVIEWLNASVARPLSASDNLSNDDLDQENDDLADPDRAETSGDIVSVPEMDEQGARIDQVCFEIHCFNRIEH